MEVEINVTQIAHPGALSYFLLTILADPIAFWYVTLIEANCTLILCRGFEMFVMILLGK